MKGLETGSSPKEPIEYPSAPANAWEVHKYRRGEKQGELGDVAFEYLIKVREGGEALTKHYVYYWKDEGGIYESPAEYSDVSTEPDSRPSPEKNYTDLEEALKDLYPITLPGDRVRTRSSFPDAGGSTRVAWIGKDRATGERKIFEADEPVPDGGSYAVPRRGTFTWKDGQWALAPIAATAGAGGGERTPRPVAGAAGAGGRERTPSPAAAAGLAPRLDARPDARPAVTGPDAVGVAPDEAAFDAMRAQLEAARRENEAEHARTLARATAERDAFKEQNTALLRAFGIRYGSGAQEVLEATMRACPLSGTPEQIAENQRIINAVIDRKNSLYASGARISKEGVPALVNTIRNEQKLKWWERFGLGKALLGSVFSGSAGALGSLAVFGCLAAPLVAAGATAGAAFALVKRRLERSNALGKGKTFLHRNPGATAAVFSVVSGLGAGAHMPDGSAYMGAFVEKLADGSKEGVGKILQLLARLRMPF